MTENASSDRTHSERIKDIPASWPRDKKIAWLLEYAWKWRARYAPIPSYTYISSEDLYSAIAIAVTQAVDGFDAARNTKLATYAVRLAKYAAFEAYRAYSHTTRSMREKGQNVQLLSMEMPLASGETLGSVISSTHSHPDSDTFANVAQRLEIVQLNAYIERLSERERFVVRGIISEMSFKDIAALMGVCESSAYQIMNRSVSKLRGMAGLDALRDSRFGSSPQIQSQACISRTKSTNT